MKKSELRQIIREEIQKEGIWGKIPFVKKNREKKLARKKEEEEYDKRAALNFVTTLKDTYEGISNYIQDSNEWTPNHKNELQRELDNQMWGLVVPDGNYGEAPENPQFDWESYKKNPHMFPYWAMNDIMDDLHQIIR